MGLIGLAMGLVVAASCGDRAIIFSPQKAQRAQRIFTTECSEFIEGSERVDWVGDGIGGGCTVWQAFDDFLTTKTQRAQRYLATEAQRFLDSGCGGFRGGCAAGQCVARRGDLSLGRPGRSPLRICVGRDGIG